MEGFLLPPPDNQPPLPAHAQSGERPRERSAEPQVSPQLGRCPETAAAPGTEDTPAGPPGGSAANPAGLLFSCIGNLVPAVVKGSGAELGTSR